MTATLTPLPRDSACCLLPPLIRDLRKAPTVLGTLSVSKSKAVSYKKAKLTLIYGIEIAIQSHSQVQERELVLIKQPKITTEISLVYQATQCFKPEEAADPLYYSIIFRTCWNDDYQRSVKTELGLHKSPKINLSQQWHHWFNTRSKSSLPLLVRTTGTFSRGQPGLTYLFGVGLYTLNTTQRTSMSSEEPCNHCCLLSKHLQNSVIIDAATFPCI